MKNRQLRLISRKVFFTSLITLLCLVVVQAQDKPTVPGPPARAEAELQIRQSYIEFTMAYYDNDYMTARQYISKRQELFYALMLGVFRETPQFKAFLETKSITTVEDLIRVDVEATAQMGKSKARDELEKMVRQNAQGTLSFKSNTEASLTVKEGAIRLVWEDQRWKVDNVDISKAIYLKLPFSEEAKTKIKKF
jgi:hypothetical protein